MARRGSVHVFGSFCGWIWLVGCVPNHTDIGGSSEGGSAQVIIGGSGGIVGEHGAGTSAQIGGATQATGGTKNTRGSGATDCDAGTVRGGKMAVGYSHVCWIRHDGTLWCWGYNIFGRMGNGSRTDVDAPVQVGTDTWTEVAAGQHFACGIRRDGTLWCWGSDINGELGGGPNPGDGTPVQVGSDATWVALSAGMTHSCALRRDNTLWCWGTDGLAETADESGGTTSAPTQVSGGAHWVAVEAGAYHTCAIRDDGTLWCWGSNQGGQLGDGALGESQRSTPTQVGTDTNWAKVSGGPSHTCAIRRNGTLWCWGAGAFLDSEIASAISDPSVPRQIGTDIDWRSVAADFEHTCGIRRNGTLWCWGDNEYGRLGDGTVIDRRVPLQVGTDSTWSGVFGGHAFLTCAIRTDGTVWCWGHDEYMLLALERSKIIWTPRKVPDPDPWIALSSSAYHVCGIRPDKSLWCWGDNLNGQLGNGSLSKISDRRSQTPTQVAPSATWSAVSAGASHTCGIRTDDTLWCWGGNGQGQVGNGDPSSADVPEPAQVAPGTTWASLATGTYHTCGIRTDRSLWCWGWDPWGQLGIGDELRTETDHPTPQQVAPGTTWTAISTEELHTCGIRTDGSLWCWGLNDGGQIGDGTQNVYDQSDWDIPIINDRAVPTEVLGKATWTSVAAGSSTTCGIRTDGTLWCWGSNENGQVGDGSATARLIPVPVGTATNWAQVITLGSHSCGIRTDGSLWCWGDNGRGQLGFGTANASLVPVHVGTDATWAQLYPSGSFTCATSTDGALWFWGENEDEPFGLPNVPMIQLGSLRAPRMVQIVDRAELVAL